MNTTLSSHNLSNSSSSSDASSTTTCDSSASSSSFSESSESIAASVDSVVRDALRTHTNSSTTGSHTGWSVLREALRTRTAISNPGSQNAWSALREALLSHPSSSNAITTAEVPRRLHDEPESEASSATTPTRSSSASSSASSSCTTLSDGKGSEARGNCLPADQQPSSTPSESGTPASSSDVSWVPLSGRKSRQDATPVESPQHTSGNRVTFSTTSEPPPPLSGAHAPVQRPVQLQAPEAKGELVPKRASSFSSMPTARDSASPPMKKQFSVPPRREGSAPTSSQKSKSFPRVPSARPLQSPAAQRVASERRVGEKRVVRENSAQQPVKEAPVEADTAQGEAAAAVVAFQSIIHRYEKATGGETLASTGTGEDAMEASDSQEATATADGDNGLGTIAALETLGTASSSNDVGGGDAVPEEATSVDDSAPPAARAAPLDALEVTQLAPDAAIHCQDPDVETIQPTNPNTHVAPPGASSANTTGIAPDGDRQESSSTDAMCTRPVADAAPPHPPVPQCLPERMCSDLYGCDDQTLTDLLANDRTLRRLHYEANRIAKASRAIETMPILPKPAATARRQTIQKPPNQQQVSRAPRRLHSARGTKPESEARQHSAPLNRKESFGLQLRSPPTPQDPSSPLSAHHISATDMDLRFRVNDPSFFAYDALHDEHCIEFLEHNKTFQSHWKSMKVHLQPNHRVTERVRDAMIPATEGSQGCDSASTPAFVPPAVASEVTNSRPTTAGSGCTNKSPLDKMAVPPIRNCLCYDVDSGTSVDVANAVTFFDKRRQQLRKGLPLVVKNPVEALLVQLQGPTGTMRASKGEPWPPDRRGPAPAPVVPRPPPPRSASTLRRVASTMRQGSFVSLHASRSFAHRPSTAEHASLGASTRSMTMSARPVSSSAAAAPRLIPGAITPKRFNARSPFLDQRDEFTTFDAMFFPDGHAMREGTVAPSLYYFSKEKETGSSRGKKPADNAAVVTETSPRVPSMSILTETHINIIVRSEDYARRQIVKRENTRSTVLFSDFVVRTTFYLERHRHRMLIADHEVAQRNEVAQEAQTGWAKLLQLSGRDRSLARRNEEVFPLCPQLGRGDSFPVRCASEQSIIVDLRWSGGDAESASLAIMVFDIHDRFAMTVLTGESLRCPISGRPVVRSWGPYRFRPLEECGAVPSSYCATSSTGGAKPTAAVSIAAPVPSMEHRSTFELLLHNLSPQATLNRFVFVVMHPKKTGAVLTPIRRAYLTVRMPVLRTEQLPTTSSSGTPTPTSLLRLGKVQTDTLTTELVSMRLTDHPNVACYTVGSLCRQWFAREEDGAEEEVFPHALSLQTSVEELGVNSRPTSGGRPTSGSPRRCGGTRNTPRRNMVSPFQRSLNAPPPLEERSAPPRAVSPIMDGPMPRSIGVSPQDSSLYVPLWKLYCHDFSDPSVPNVHRLPGVLESALFMNEADIWWSYVQAVVKLERMSDEFYEKIVRSKIELDEANQRAILYGRKSCEHEDVVVLTTINPLKAAMMRTKDRATRAASSQPGGARRISSAWSGTLQSVRAQVVLSKRNADKAPQRPQPQQ